MKIEIPIYVNLVINTLEDFGFEAYVVGGCVRDSLLGKVPYDWDITTSATPNEILKIFVDFKTIATGAKHGTITVLIDGHPIEITTFRVDGEYSDSRHPDSVVFSTTLQDDLSRRDFTVNAMAYNEKTSIIDIFNGAEDLRRKTIRCVGDAENRFSEDALRIMRCLRFSATLGFEVESRTLLAAKNKQKLLKNISCERIRDELKKLVCGVDADSVLRKSSEIFFEIAPELKLMSTCAQENPYHIYSVWEHSLHALNKSPPKTNIRLAALLHDCGKPSCKTVNDCGVAHFYGHVDESVAIAETFLRRLRFSNHEIDYILAMIKNHSEILPMPEKRIKKLIAKLGEDGFFDLLNLIRADASAQSPSLFKKRIALIDECKIIAQEIILSNSCLKLKDLSINGNDLIELGFEKDKRLGDALHLIFNLVLENKVKNERETLLKLAKSML